jgi:hypothetical protein
VKTSGAYKMAGCLLQVTVYLIIWIAITRFAFSAVNRAIERGWRKSAVSSIHTSFPFPIVAVSQIDGGVPAKPIIITDRDLREENSDRSHYSFIIPRNLRNGSGIKPLMESVTPFYTRPVCWYEMKPLANGNQSFHVVITHDSEDRGTYTYASWYVATPKGIIPKYYNWNRDWNTFANILMPVWFLYTCLWFIVRWGYRRILRPVGNNSDYLDRLDKK